ncbi:hypothetical protein ROHU_028583 [Labeo rohita]|uniref:Uncharacterized protein n=1 Tax=Labeo rohita TaxID=84645 RepID=A0A498M254_LABRO|nr:hypothetical protein ROHU_028583 [Labeo rohita]
MAVGEQFSFQKLTRRHAIKLSPPEGASVEDCSLVVGGRSQSPSTVSQQQNNSLTSDQKQSGTAHIYDSVDAAVNKDISTDSVSEPTELTYAKIDLKSKSKKKKENKGAGSGDVTYTQDYSVYDDVDLWGDVCKDLEVPNTFANRVKIRKATAHLWKGSWDIFTKDVKDDSPCAEKRSESSDEKDGSDVGHWESPILERDDESSFEKDTLPESDAANKSHLKKPETQQLESPFPDQKDSCENLTTALKDSPHAENELESLSQKAFQTDMMKLYGKKAVKRPIMIICDGSLVILNSISLTFCKLSLEDLLQKYFEVITGQYQAESMQRHYKLGMHTFGLLACSTSLKQMDEVLLSATVVFSSPCSGDNVEKHYNNLVVLMQQVGKLEIEEQNIVAEDYKAETKGSSADQMYVEPKTLEQTEKQRKDFWLTSDIIDLASYIMAKDNVHIDGFQFVLPFSAIATGGIVGTPKNKFVQILHIRQNHWITLFSIGGGCRPEAGRYTAPYGEIIKSTLGTYTLISAPSTDID